MIHTTSWPYANETGITEKLSCDVLVLGGGLAGIWYAFPFGLTSAGILYYVFFKRTLASQPPSNPPKGGEPIE